MFKLLRSKAKIFYWVIAASFILFIFLAWGMDLRGSGGRQRSTSDSVGSVNGTEISAAYWSRAYQQTVRQLRQQAPDRTLNADQAAHASERTWDQVVRSVLIEQEIQRLGLTVSEDEILETFRNNPPPELLAGYLDENGQPDLARYFADLQNPERDWRSAEQYIRSILPQRKLQEILTAGAMVTDIEVEEAYLRQTRKVVAEYIGVLYSDLENDYEPSDEEIQEYYQQHLGVYKQGAKARVQAVTWRKEASEADNEEVRQDLGEVRMEIIGGERDFASAASIYSQDEGSAERGGDLGTFDRNRMVAAFTEVAFSLPVGEISEPVKTQFGYHLIEVLEQFTDDEGELEKVHARHILFKVDPGENTMTSLYDAARDFREQAAAGEFGPRAEEQGLEIVSSEPFEKGRTIPGLPLSASGSYWSFEAEVGDLSPVFENKDAFYVLSLTEMIPPTPSPVEDVRSRIVIDLKRENDRRLAAEKLSPAVGKMQMGLSMVEAAEEYGLHHATTDTITATSNVTDVGYGTAFNLAALGSEVGELTSEVGTLRGLYALRPVWKSDFDEAEFALQRDIIYANLLRAKQNQLLEAWFQQKMAEADIVDDRGRRRENA